MKELWEQYWSVAGWLLLIAANTAIIMYKLVWTHSSLRIPIFMICILSVGALVEVCRIRRKMRTAESTGHVGGADVV